MQTKQPVHKLVLLLLFALLYLPGCTDSSANDDQTASQDVAVKVRVATPPDESGRSRWETTFVRKLGDTLPYMIIVPPSPLSYRSDSGGGSAPDTISLQMQKASKDDRKKKSDDDDK